MLDYLAITTFSDAGFEVYGRRFVASWDCFASHLGIGLETVRDTDLASEPGWREFQDTAPPVSAPPASYWERWDQNGRRFSHKVFAVTSARRQLSEWLLWIDADVEFHAPLTRDLLADICPVNACLSFLGRRDFPWSECGFVAYKVSDPKVRALLADMRLVYTSGELFTLPRDRWHDSAVFDICRLRSGIPESEQCNLSAGVRGREVWEHTLLQQFARHNKGPARKLRVYGGLAE